MADRLVTRICRFRTGEIIALCNPIESWSPVTIYDACTDIISDNHKYYVLVRNERVSIVPTSGVGESLLVARMGDCSFNYLEVLPEFNIFDVNDMSICPCS